MQRLHHPLRLRKGDFRLFPSFIGLLISASFFLTYDFSLHLLMSSLFLFLVHKWKKKGRGILLSFLLGVALGGTLFGIYRLLPFPDSNMKGVAIVLEAKENYAIVLFKGRKAILFEKGTLLEEGDLLSLEGRFGPFGIEHFESRFDFEGYLKGKGVIGRLEASKKEILLLRPFRLREKELAFLSSFKDPTRGVLDSFLFNRKDYQNEILSKADDLNLLFLFSSSGIYLSLFRRFANYLFSFSKNKKVAAIGSFASLFLLSFFSLAKVGAFRVLCMGFFDFERGIRGKEKIPYLAKLSLSGVCCFLRDPFSIMEEAFLLGFFLSLYLWFQRKRISALPSKGKRALKRFLVCFAFLFPCHVKRNAFRLLSPFGALLLPPVTVPFLLLGHMAFLGIPLRNTLGGYASFLSSFLDVFGKINVAIPLFGDVSAWKCVYYFLLFAILYLKDIGLTILKNVTAFVPLCLFLLSSLPATNYLSYQVSFIDVSQGDSILVRIGTKAMLVDTGGTLRFDIAKEVLVPFLRKEKVTRLDYLVLTHDDFDHSGAKETLPKSFSVLNTIESKSAFPLSFEGIRFDNLNPLEGSEKDKNKGSIVLSFELGDKKYLLMGDATKECEKAMIERGLEKHDILKVGHHGSSTSTSELFLDALNPKEAIISCGTNNKYGHPDPEVVQKLEKKGITLRRTDLEGTITYQGFLKRGFSFF